MQFKPETLGHRVILKPYTFRAKKEGMIDLSALDDRSQAVNSDKGEVLLVGTACWFDKPEVERDALRNAIVAGVNVYYSKYGAKVLKDTQSGELFIICNDEDILVGYTDE